AESGGQGVEHRRLAADVAIACGIARFFAAKFRSAVLWALHERSGDREAADAAVESYRAARQAWASAADSGSAVYFADSSFGREPWLRGSWSDRLPAIDADIEEMAKLAASDAVVPSGDPERIRGAVRQIFAPPPRPGIDCAHQFPGRFVPGQPLELTLSVPDAEL